MSVEDGENTASYTYDGNNLRQSKTVNGVTTTHIYDGAEVTADITGDRQSVYVRDLNGILFREENGEKMHYISNPRGDVSAYYYSRTRLLPTYTYDAFGNQTEASGTDPFRYSGEYYDAESGFIYLRNRYYDPSIGRFITEDPAQSGTNWYVYANNNPLTYIDPWGLDAIVVTNHNSVDILGKKLGHTSALYQNAKGDWYYTYWGNKAAAVIRIASEYMGSLSDFNTGLNKFLSDNGFSNITSDYTDATYIVGNFTASLKAAYADVNDAATSRFSEKNGLTVLNDGSIVFQGHNSPYNAGYRNCFDKTYASLSEGTLPNGMNVGSYMRELGFKGGMIPNNAISKFNEVFMNQSFKCDVAQNALSNYVRLYNQGHPWAQKKLKAGYALKVVGE